MVQPIYGLITLDKIHFSMIILLRQSNLIIAMKGKIEEGKKHNEDPSSAESYTLPESNLEGQPYISSNSKPGVTTPVQC